eukprot:TRINITY_DN5441_c0_g1_i6.p1 TRINITY_DN5441_c0_g1~~TRINITY_DN5441_c0_g1_i6.p1  ORF type:complete len:152 (-),score=10.85 TRINITY_DN5441_c0_g1_i6:33-488(-)
MYELQMYPKYYDFLLIRQQSVPPHFLSFKVFKAKVMPELILCHLQLKYLRKLNLNLLCFLVLILIMDCDELRKIKTLLKKIYRFLQVNQLYISEFIQPILFFLLTSIPGLNAFSFSSGFSIDEVFKETNICLLYTSPSPRDRQKSRMPSSA